MVEYLFYEEDFGIYWKTGDFISQKLISREEFEKLREESGGEVN